MITQLLPLAFLLGDDTPMDLFIKGKEIMWPILLLSFVAITVVIERIIFIVRENASREPEVVQKMLESVEHGDIDAALSIGKKSNDFRLLKQNGSVFYKNNCKKRSPRTWPFSIKRRIGVP